MIAPSMLVLRQLRVVFILNDFKRQDNKTYGLIRLPAAAHSLKIKIENTEGVIE